MRGGLRPWSERVDFDHGQVVARGLGDVTIVMRLDEIGPVDRRSAGGRERWRLERLAEVREDLPDRCRVGKAGRAHERTRCSRLLK